MTGLDLSDFPALADRSRREGNANPTPLLNPLAGRAPYGKADKQQASCCGVTVKVPRMLLSRTRFLLNLYFFSVGMVTKPTHEQSQDFSIHNEDFPALPGANFKDPTCTDDSKTVYIHTHAQTHSHLGT